jgi:hypothetical protein
MTPLMFAARLTAVPILAETVTFLQQFLHRFRFVEAEMGLRGDARRNEGGAENHGGHLPKSWANAGAFSPLTLKSKLAHY